MIENLPRLHVDRPSEWQVTDDGWLELNGLPIARLIEPDHRTPRVHIRLNKAEWRLFGDDIAAALAMYEGSLRRVAAIDAAINAHPRRRARRRRSDTP